MIPISDNGVSRVWRDDPWVYKRQPKFLTDNEIWCLQLLYPSGYVPFAEQVDIDTIRLEYIHHATITDPDTFQAHCRRLLATLQQKEIRHGDLTQKNLLVRDNHPYVIDFSESRLSCDPRPDKRREGDEYWLNTTIKILCQK